ncbi:ATP-dependent Clp protease adaptor ClpS [Francisellaceae bacterium]|nr:ATP-dependent Clp protease adaptor ClpS [Francisellaceae bacterium]
MQADVSFEDAVAELSLEQRVSGGTILQVLLVNDDYTPMEFVADTLSNVFEIDEASASSLMMLAHYDGKALCGIYPESIAEAKAHEVVEEARKNGHPLLCVTQKLF